MTRQDPSHPWDREAQEKDFYVERSPCVKLGFGGFSFWTLKLLSEVSEIGVYNRTRKIKYVMKFKKSLDLLNHYSLCGPCLLSHRLELISLALGNEGYFDTERERHLGS